MSEANGKTCGGTNTAERVISADAERTWKSLFNVLFNNKQSVEKLPTMWAQFKKGRLHKSDIGRAIESMKNEIHEDMRKKLSDNLNS